MHIPISRLDVAKKIWKETINIYRHFCVNRSRISRKKYRKRHHCLHRNKSSHALSVVRFFLFIQKNKINFVFADVTHIFLGRSVYIVHTTANRFK